MKLGGQALIWNTSETFMLTRLRKINFQFYKWLDAFSFIKTGDPGFAKFHSFDSIFKKSFVSTDKSKFRQRAILSNYELYNDIKFVM